MEISRREFLKLLGISTAGVTLTGLGMDSLWSVPDHLYQQIGGMPGIETWKTSVCSLCPAACGIKVRLIDGIPVRILGNPLHRVNRGGICPMGEAGVESLFNPDRIKAPLKRVGQRGAGKWENISWEEAIETLLGHIQALRDKNAIDNLAFLTGNRRSLQSMLIKRFMQSCGSPHLFFEEGDYPHRLTSFTQGHQQDLGVKLEEVQFLLNFGGDFLDAAPGAIRFNKVYAELRNPPSGHAAKIVHIDSRLSRTAGKSSEWIPIAPGTMAALALGIANVLIKDRQYDTDFIRKHTFGFDDWTDAGGGHHKGFRSLVAQEYYPERVAKITGIAASRIVTLARQFGASDRALALAGGQASAGTNSFYTVWAIDCLNVLAGNYGRDRLITMVPHPPFAMLADETPPEQEPARDIGMNPLDQLMNMAQEGKPNPIAVLLVAGSNPMFSAVHPARVKSALQQIPFIVSFSPFIDDTSAYADLILPDHSFLEKEDIYFNQPLVPFSHFGVQQAVIDPLYDTRHSGEVLLQVAGRLGGRIARGLPWKDYREYLRFRLSGIYDTGAGAIFSERVDAAWLKYLKERGWQIFAYTNFEEFRNVLYEKGGWWNPFSAQSDFTGRFRTVSGKYEFYSRTLEESLNAMVAPDGEVNNLLKKLRIEARGDAVFLPHYEAERFYQPDAQFDLHLLTYPLLTNSTGTGGNLPLAQELFGMWTREYWNSWLEINPETARRYGIREGHLVSVSSPRGTLVVKAKLLQAVMPGVVYIPFGMGHQFYGRYGGNVGVNPNHILEEDYDFLNGNTSLTSTRIKVRTTSQDRKQEYA